MTIIDTPIDTGLTQAAEKIRPLVAEQAAAADTAARLPAEVIAALTECGFSRHFVPSRWGGQDGSFAEVTQAVAALAEECANTAWCASLAAYAGRFGAFLPESGQAKLWRDGPDPFIVAALVPSGAAEEFANGWRVTGKWHYCSGIEFADWALICGPAGDRAQAKFFAVPRSECRIIPAWDSIGLRATASHTIEVDTFVASDLVFPFAQLAAGKSATSGAKCHHTPIRSVGNLAFIAPALGAATGALNSAVSMLKLKPHHPNLDLILVRSSAQIDSARLLIERNAHVADTEAPTPELLARNERDAALGAELLCEAVNGLVRACGTSGLSESQPLQRFWRDTIAAASHVALRFETAAVKFYSEHLLGGQPGAGR